jgi:hypothetical protein
MREMSDRDLPNIGAPATCPGVGRTDELEHLA